MNSQKENSPGEVNQIWKTVVLFDESGSMNNMMVGQSTAVDTINEFIVSQKKIAEDAGSNDNTLSLYFFNDLLREVFVDELMKDVQPIKKEDYNPDGSTALLDAVGKTINEFSEFPKVFMVILTDGLENSSSDFDSSEINILIKEKKKLGWNFRFLGTNQDSWKTGKTMGLDRADCSNYECSQPGLLKAMRNMSEQVSQTVTPQKKF